LTNQKTKDKRTSILLAESYLFFFSLGGINLFDIHAQAFFIFLFLVGYFLYIKGHPYLAVIVFFVSGTVRFPFIIFPIIFSLITLLEIVIGKNKSNTIDKKSIKALTGFTIVSTIFLFLSYYLEFTFNPTPISLATDLHVSAAESTGIYGTILDNFFPKVITFVLFLTPFLFLPIRSFKWFLLTVPFWAILLIANKPYYLFPQIATDQYSAAIIPFLYIGTIEKICKSDNRTGEHNVKLNSNFVHKINKILRKPTSIFVASLLLFIFFSPISPLSSLTNPSYDTPQQLQSNLTSYAIVNELTNLIPRNDSYVFFQGNEPEVILHNPNIPITMDNFVFGFPYNLSYELPNGSWTHRIDYVLADSNNILFTWYRDKYTFNLSMYELIQKLYFSGNFGIMAEIGGFVLLKYNYTGPIVYYQPIYDSFPPSDLSTYNNSYRREGVISGINTTGEVLWYGPFTFLYPGTYTVTYLLSTSNNLSSNSITLWSGDYAENKYFFSAKVTGKNFSTENSLQFITFRFVLDNFYNDVEFGGYNAYWNGSLTLHSIIVRQI
jgi:uncharacterized membrane protein